MGYTTDFDGKVKLDKPLTVAQFAYLKAFNESRRMQRKASDVSLLTDELRVAAGLPVGVEGGYFVAGGSDGSTGRQGVLNHNKPPQGQPGLWCQWMPTKDGLHIEWDGGEKFYDYIEWMKYIIEHFLQPWRITANGMIRWYGEERSDVGTIVVTNNVVQTTPNLLNDDAKPKAAKHYTAHQLVSLIAQVEGTVTVSGGVLHFADGTSVDLMKMES